MTLHLRTNGMIKEIAETEEVYFYRYDVCDGRSVWTRKSQPSDPSAGRGWKTGVLEVVYEMEPSKTVHRRSLSRRKQTENSWRKQPDLLRRLGKCFQKVPDEFVSNGNPRGRYDFGRISVF